ncbi:MAG TPA: bifunctional oligoribonuclease/PAP phosphatase NrnA [Gemmatimonadaceae bacterium]|nr:bifunctional oligoribonuclease/PAP phosphatase NrnA [Gemmatimonadaceae bacterium]
MPQDAIPNTPAQSVDLLAVPEHRRAAIARLAAELRPGLRVALSTHMNADGDGCGSEAALARILGAMGMDVRIVNPTPWPAMFDFLGGNGVRDLSPKGAAALRGIDLLVVLDISDVKRLGVLADAVRGLTVPKLVIDHHIATDEPAGSITLTDTAACATGELVYDLASILGANITEPIAKALYTALLTDTGGFRFSNTTPRCHAVAGRLLAAGVDPEDMYRRIYASVSLKRLQLLRDALDTLRVDEENGVAWISVPAGALEQYGLQSEDLDGIVEHPRSIVGTRLALFFRDLGHGKVKVSFRSTGDVDVNQFARRFGGGGHARASGALVAGTLEQVRDSIVDAAREFVRAGPLASEGPAAAS